MPLYENAPFYISAYGIAVDRGFIGDEDEWLASLRGERGHGVTILGAYPDETALRAAHPAGKPGDNYLVGTFEDFLIYFWNELEGDWGSMDIRGPEGPMGPVGPQGETGAAGPKGETGLPGPKGETGDTGPKGETGPAGQIGPQGITGDTGPAGSRGWSLLLGGLDYGERRVLQVLDWVGGEGQPPDNSPTRYIGLYGLVTDINLAKDSRGSQGPEGDTGLTGPKGDTGNTGPKGDTGLTGPKGDTGLTGSKGDTGNTGPAGYTPVRGTDYWTAADIAAMELYIRDYADAQIGTVNSALEARLLGS